MLYFALIITPHPGILGFLANTFPNILAANVPKHVPRNPPFYFVSFLIGSQTSFISKPDSSRDLKVVSATFLLVFFLSLKESTCETRKKFCFTSKVFFVLEKIKF